MWLFVLFYLQNSTDHWTKINTEMIVHVSRKTKVKSDGELFGEF